MAYVNVRVSKSLKEELAWVTDKRLRVISNIMNSHTTKKLKNKVVLSLLNIVCVAMWSLVTYSNCLIIYYRCCMDPPLRYVLCVILYHYTINNDYIYVVLYFQRLVFRYYNINLFLMVLLLKVLGMTYIYMSTVLHGHLSKFSNF